MTKWSSRRIIALLLGLWVVFAPAAYAVSAVAMPLLSTMNSDAGSDCCDGCAEGDADGTICVLMCFSATLLATVLERGKLSPIAGEGCGPARHPAMMGRSSTPDPAPPRPTSLL